MDLVQLVTSLGIECGVSSAVNITTAQGLTGSLGRLVNWVQQSWTEIQTKHDDWEFMRSSNILGQGASWVPASGQMTSPLGTGAGTCGVDPTLFGKWAKDTFRSYTTASGGPSTGGEMFLDHIDYDSFRDGYMLGAMRAVVTRPVAVAIGPNKSVCLGPPPNGLYTITGDFYMAPTQMALDTDTPIGLPNQFHMAIVYKGMMKYGAYESAGEVYERGKEQYKELIYQLENTYAPMIMFAGSL